MTTEERVLNKVLPAASGCWEWQASIDRYGYGRVKFMGRNVQAHRLTYTLFVGPIPTGMVLDHLCRNRCCCNPAHLEPITLEENTRRGFAARGY